MLEDKLNTLASTAFVNSTVKFQKYQKLTQDELEAICRYFKTVKVPVVDDKVDWSTWRHEALPASEYWEEILKPYLVLTTCVDYFSNVVGFTQYKYPRFCSFTSLPMLAAREASNIPYLYWKRGVPKDRWNFLFFKDTARQLMMAPDIHEYNKVKVTSSLLDACIKEDKGPLWHVIEKAPMVEDEETGEIFYAGFNSWPKAIRHMKLQTWLFHPSVRDENSMVLHPINWDFIPPIENSLKIPTVDDGPSFSDSGLSLETKKKVATNKRKLFFSDDGLDV